MNAIMISNYLKVASRNIAKRKLYSFINAFGLSIGIAFCILIYLYIQDEKSFDQFHVNKEQIYRLEEKSFNTWRPDTENPFNRSAWLQLGLMQAVKDEIPEVVKATRFIPESEGIVKYGDQVFTEKLSYVDSDFFSMFSFPLLKGNSEKLFNSKSDLVITPQIAEKYFGSDDPIGKTISIETDRVREFIVAGVIEAPPANSSLGFSILVPQENRAYYEKHINSWGNFNTPTFVQLAPNTDLKKFSANLDKLIQKMMGKMLEDWRKESSVPVPENVKIFEIEFTNLSDIHLKNEIGWDKVSDQQYSYILGGIALLILVIACINYISLALTTSTSRRTEVGIRKVVGAQRGQIVSQFGFESFILAFLAMIIGMGLVLLFLPFFNEYTNKQVALTIITGFQLMGVAFLLTIVVGFLAGSYPAIFLSGFRPAHVLKGRFTSKLQAGFTRPLVVLQFALSGFLIISSVIMYQQMRYVTTKDLGFNQEQLLVIPTQGGWGSESDKVVERYRSRLQNEPSVVSVAGTTTSFAQGYSMYGYKINGEQKSAYVYGIDPYYLPTLGVKFVAGRNFDLAIPSDSNAVIVNEALVRDMKWADPLNEHLNYREDTVGLGAKVIGVVKDYHFLSLTQDIKPMLLSMNKRDMGYLSLMLIKIRPEGIPQTIEKLHQAWKDISPGKPFDYTFLDQNLAKQYESYNRWMNIMGLSTVFAILISCLGLFGLAGVNAVNKTKEIGIRKVMGAELSNIFVLLNKQYVYLSVIAFTMAAPASWYVMNKWLSDFRFKIEIGWELFVASMLVGLMIAILTVSYHSIKASLINPAETLKHE